MALMAITSLPACSSTCCRRILNTSLPPRAAEILSFSSTNVATASPKNEGAPAYSVSESSNASSHHDRGHGSGSQAQPGWIKPGTKRYEGTSSEAHGLSTRGSDRQAFVFLDFNLVFNSVVVLTNVAYCICTAMRKIRPTSLGEWLSTLIILNIVFPGIIVTIDSLPGDLGTYLLIVVIESVVWLVLADWRLRGTFQKQSECILVLLLWSICTSYVAWSIPALYMGFVGGKLDARLGVMFAMLVQGSCYYLLELVLVEEHRRLFENAEGSAWGQGGTEERIVVEEEALEELTSLIVFARGRVDRRRMRVQQAGGQLNESAYRHLRQESCAICASDLVETKKSIVLRRLDWCGHAFHRQCVDEWLLRHNASCPLCRQRPPELVM